ncbi:hypothetical protein [Corynebacterium sp. ES2715-CONJ3]|uniref:hypothetical protein n=1 Tax=Corynebacterium sp. ES2715-CONJ3 TaxID=2974028 RepID=UPI00216838AD|nr:hypothetical protein [Corynebacterium sp. ES2715-CONJ3]MCS4492432.1 hypothetical protein [Corynebacterium sp. ES2715-CONJ3]
MLDPYQQLQTLLQSPAAVRSVREFEKKRHLIGSLDPKPDKFTTVFVNETDLVWAWIGQEMETFVDQAVQLSRTRIDASYWADNKEELLQRFVGDHEFVDPPLVAALQRAGGLSY